MDYQMRHIGVMLCGKYCVLNQKEDNCLYMAYNMHWEPHDFALPKLFKDRRWKLLLETETEKNTEIKAEKRREKEAVQVTVKTAQITENGIKKPAVSADTGSQSVMLPERSIHIYISEEVPKTVKRRRYKK